MDVPYGDGFNVAARPNVNAIHAPISLNVRAIHSLESTTSSLCLYDALVMIHR